MGKKTGILLCFLWLVLTCLPLHAQVVERDMEYQQEIIAELELLAPEAVAYFRAATSAMDQENFETAEELFAQVLKDAPRFDAAIRRRGFCLYSLGRREEAIGLEEEALQIKRSPETLSTLARIVAFPDGMETADDLEVKRALELNQEALRLDPTEFQILVLQVQLALAAGRIEVFRAASLALSQHHPEEMITHYFASFRLADEGQWGPAEAEIRAAGELGLPQEAVQEFLDETGISGRKKAWRWAGYMGIVTGAWILGLILLFVVGKTLSAVTLRSVERDDPNRAVSGSTHRLRSLYRRVITLAGFYYYVSLPFVAFLVLTLTAAILYGFWMAGTIPIKLAVLLAVGALATVFAIIGSLFVRMRDDEDPGRGITEEEAPRLWAMVREVAGEVDTRAVDEIWLTPGTELAVFERGSVRARMEDRGRRALLLGAGVLDDFQQNAFRAVLAHEYGHFTHRDTAGGDVALRVTNGMVAFATALAKSGFAVWWNLGVHFLRIYGRLFRRISHGATRLQEILADRVAVQRYGLESLKEGLTHVVRRSILFDGHLNLEVRSALESRGHVTNLYQLAEPNDPGEKASLVQVFEEALRRETSEYDTHPSPEERFRLAARITGGAAPPRDGSVWGLFEDPVGLKEEMTKAVDGRVQEYAKATAQAQSESVDH